MAWDRFKSRYTVKALANLSSASTKLLFGRGLQFLGGADLLQNVGVLVANGPQHFMFEPTHGFNGNGIEIAARAGKNGRRPAPRPSAGENCGCFKSSVRRAPRAKQLLGNRIKVGAELGEGRHFTVLRQLALDATRHLLHRLDLGR